MITVDANETIQRLLKILDNEIVYHELGIETVTDVGRDIIEYLKCDVEDLNELKKIMIKLRQK